MLRDLRADRPIELPDMLVVPGRKFSRAEVVRVIQGAASIIASSVAVVFSAPY
jgi:hypothetical protein